MFFKFPLLFPLSFRATPSNKPESSGGSDMTHLWEVVDEATKVQKNSSSTPASPVGPKDSPSLLKKSMSSGDRKLSQQQMRNNFLEGFRHTLGGRGGDSRPEGIASIMQQQQLEDQASSNGSSSMLRRWSESSPSRTVRNDQSITMSVVFYL